MEGSSTKGDTSAGLARRAERRRPGADVFGPEVADEFVDAGYFEISAKDHPDPFGFLLNDGELAVLQLIAEGEGATHPKPFALGGGNLVPDTLGGDLPLELGKGQQHVEVSRPMDVVVLNCWVTETKETPWASNSSTSFAKSASDLVRRSTL